MFVHNALMCISSFFTICFTACQYKIRNDQYTYNQRSPISLDNYLVSREQQSQPDAVWKSIRSGRRSIVRSDVSTGPGRVPLTRPCSFE